MCLIETYILFSYIVNVSIITLIFIFDNNELSLFYYVYVDGVVIILNIMLSPIGIIYTIIRLLTYLYKNKLFISKN